MSGGAASSHWGPLRLTPPLAAAAIYGLGQGRGYFAVPEALGMVALVARGLAGAHSTRACALSGAAGALLGGLAGLLDPPYSPYLPGPLLSAICGGLAALTLYCVASRSVQYSGVYAWVLTALSTDVRIQSVGLTVALLVLAASTLAVATSEAGVWSSGRTRAGALGLTIFVAVVLPGAMGLASLAKASVDPLLGFVMRMTQDLPHPHGVGLDTELRLRRVSQVPDDDTVLFEITSPTPARLRSIVFDQFDGEVWRVSDALSRQRLAFPTTGGYRHAELTFAEEVGPMVPVPPGTTRVSGPPAEVHGGWVARAAKPLRAETVGVDYAASATLLAEAGAGWLELPPNLAAEMLPLAQGIVGSATSARGRATAVERFFADHFEYTLLTDLSGPGNPLLRLIRERKPAYCIYFASAAAALLRSLGIPARVVGGFVPGDPNPLTGRATVRGRDAHAWVEYFVPEAGRFEAIDPTPWRSRSALTPRPGPFALALEGLRSAMRLRYLQAGGTPGRALLAVFGSRWLLGLIVVLVGLRLSRIRRRPRPAAVAGPAEAEDARLLDAYQAYRELLTFAGAPSPHAHESEEEYLGRLRALGAMSPAEAAAGFLAAYHRARFGGDAVPSDGWATQLAELRRALQSSPLAPKRP